MARLVILSESQMGRSFDLIEGTTTVGRVEDNAFQIAEPSVSSHHGEIVFEKGTVTVRDLNSTNGTFINGQQITSESPLKPGQILRLGQIELRLEAGASATATAASSADATPAAGPTPPPRPAASRPSAPSAPSSSSATTSTTKGPAKKLPDQTMVIPQGVKLGQDHNTKAPFENGAFSKKSNTGTKIFVITAIVIGVIVVAFFVLHLLGLVG
jgi:predicted component of type VI protein secretion system